MSAEPLKNCRNCAHLGSDDSGGDFETHSWPVCNLDKRGTWLKSFPFIKEQSCHEPGFWQYLDLDRELGDMFKEETSKGDFPKYDLTYKRFQEKYCQPAPTPSAKGGT